MKTYTNRYGRVLQVVDTTYSDGNTAVLIVQAEDGEEYATLSVNLPRHAHQLRAGEFFAKTYSENEEIAEDARKAGVVVDTGVRINTEIGQTPVWRCR